MEGESEGVKREGVKSEEAKSKGRATEVKGESMLDGEIYGRIAVLV